MAGAVYVTEEMERDRTAEGRKMKCKRMMDLSSSRFFYRSSVQMMRSEHLCTRERLYIGRETLKRLDSVIFLNGNIVNTTDLLQHTYINNRNI